MFTWLIGVTGDALSWIWHVVGMSTIAVLATCAIRVPKPLAPHGLR